MKWILLSLLLVSCTTFSEKQENARNHAEALGLKDYKISCDASLGECSCTISYETETGRVAETYQCCGSGCSKWF